MIKSQFVKKIRLASVEMPLISLPADPREFYWIDLIVGKSDQEEAAGTKDWSYVLVGRAGACHIPLLNFGSVQSYPYVGGQTNNGLDLVAKYVAGSALADVQKPYIIFSGEY